MSISAKEAGLQVGLTRQAIIKAIKRGKLSASKDNNGEWLIDPSELFRVYKPVPTTENGQVASGIQQSTQNVAPEISGLQEQISLLKNERDDLRRRLDSETEERRRLTLLLSDNRTQKPAQRSFWSHLRGTT